MLKIYFAFKYLQLIDVKFFRFFFVHFFCLNYIARSFNSTNSSLFRSYKQFILVYFEK